MVIIWKRKGILVPLAFIIGVLIVGSNRTLNQSNSDGALVMLLCTLFNFLFTFLFVRNEVEWTEEEFEAQLNQLREKNPKYKYGNFSQRLVRFMYSKYSRFFFIRNKYWTYIFLVLALIFFIQSRIF